MRKAAIAFLTFVAAVCLAAFTFAACSNSEDPLELAEFPVPESVTAQYQTVFTLPVVTAKDTEGNEYIATAEVSDASGNKIVLDGYSFFVDSTEDYTAVYRVRAGGKRAEKSMKIVVEGEAKDIVRLRGTLLYLEQETFSIADDASFSIVDALDQPLTGDVTYNVTDLDGNEIPLSADLKFDVTDGTVYEISVTVNGVTAYDKIRVLGREKRVDEKGVYTYADFGRTEFDVTDTYMFSRGYYSANEEIYSNSLGGVGAGWALHKAYNAEVESWSYIFLTDGYADFTEGATVYFDITATSGNLVTSAVTWYPVNGEPVVFEPRTTGYYQLETYSFEVPAGGTLVGGRLAFTCPGGTYGHSFGNVRIAPRQGTLSGETRHYVQENTTVGLSEEALGYVYTAPAGTEKASLEFKVTKSDGTEVALLADGKSFTAEQGLYYVDVKSGNYWAKERLEIGARSQKFDENGNYVYADLAAGDADTVLFEMDFPWEYSNGGINKPYNTIYNEWSYTFRSDAYASFAKDQVVSFDLLSINREDTVIAKWTPAGGESQVIFEGMIYPWQPKTLSFKVPAGGTLEGGKITLSSAYVNLSVSLQKVTVGDVKAEVGGETFLFVEPGDTVDLANDFDIEVTVEGTPYTGALRYEVKDMQGGSPAMSGNTFTAEKGQVYTVSLYTESGITSDTKLIVYSKGARYDADGNYIYAQFTENDVYDGGLFATDIDHVLGANGIEKLYSISANEWSITFLHDAYYTFEGESVVKFTIYSLNATEPTSVKAVWVPADGDEQTLFDGQIVWFQEYSMRFTVPAGGTLAGGKIVFTSGNAGLSLCVDNFIIGLKEAAAEGETFFAVNQQAQIDLDELLSGLVLKDENGDTVTAARSYAVRNSAGDPVGLDAGNAFTTSADPEVYTVTIRTENGYTCSENITIYSRNRRTTSTGRYIYADFGPWVWQDTSGLDTTDAVLFDTHENFTNEFNAIGNVGVVGSAPDPRFGMVSVWNATPAVLEFLSNGHADFGEGATVYFDICNYYGGTLVLQSVKWYAPGSTEGITIGENISLEQSKVATLSFQAGAAGIAGGRIEITKTAETYNIPYTVGYITVAENSMQPVTLVEDFAVVKQGTAIDLDEIVKPHAVRGGSAYAGDLTYKVFEYSITESGVQQGAEVTLSGSAFTTDAVAKAYIVTAYAGGTELEQKFTVYSRSERMSGDEYTYVDFSVDGTDAVLFDTDFAPLFYAGLNKPYTHQSQVWNYTFRSDAHYNFAKGATVTFTMVSVNETDTVKVTWIPASGESVEIFNDELVAWQSADVSFYIPAGGTLKGGTLRFENAETPTLSVSISSVKIAESKIALAETAEKVVAAEQGEEVDLAQMLGQYILYQGKPYAGEVTYTVRELDLATMQPVGEPLALTENRFNTDTGAVKAYAVSVNAGGTTFENVLTVYSKNARYAEDTGRYIYADFGPWVWQDASGLDTTDAVLFDTHENFTNEFNAIGNVGVVGSAPDPRFGFTSVWNATPAELEFLSNGHADFGEGATVYFDICNYYGGMLVLQSVKWYAPGSTEGITIGENISLEQSKVATLSFQAGAAGIAGGRIEITKTAETYNIPYTVGYITVAENGAQA